MSRQVTPDTPEVVTDPPILKMEVVPFQDIQVGDLVMDMTGDRYEVLEVDWTDRYTPLLLQDADHPDSSPRWEYSLNAPFTLLHRP